MDKTIAASGPASDGPGMSLPAGGAGKRLARWASIGLVGVLLFLVSFAIWTARSMNQQVREVATSVVHSDAHSKARSAIAEEDFWVTEYLLKLGPAKGHIDSKVVRQRHREAARSMIESLVRVEQVGDARDRRFVNGVLRDHRSYLVAAARLFDAIDKGDSETAIAIEFDVIDPLFARIEEQVTRESSAHRDAALEQLASMRRSERLVYIATVIAFLIGSVLLLAFMVVLRTISRRAEQVVQIELARLEEAALIDSLTLLRNRRAFHEDLTRELAISRSGVPLSVALLDLRGLKRVNDSLGHLEGDEQLRILARVLRETMRGSDAVYRIGGDEFAVILIGESSWGAFQIIEQLQAEVALLGGRPRLLFAAGITEAVEGIAPETLLRRADLALIESKRSRRGVVVYGRELEPTAA
jgi:diguanylate cyclase (GGDEF)-like protein